MKRTSLVLRAFAPFSIALLASWPVLAAEAQPTRQPDEAVNAADVRQRPGLRPNQSLLFNGWGVTPAGTQVPVSDLALKLVVSPDRQRLVAVHGGFTKHGVSLIDLGNRKEAQFIPLGETWNGLAFSRDGGEFFVAGGDSGRVHVFKYAGGEARLDRSGEPSGSGKDVFLAGLAVSPRTGKLYVCNEGNHEIWVVDPATLGLESRIAVGQHPHSCLFGADRRHLYVSDWGSRAVSVVDTEAGRRVRDITVGLRPDGHGPCPGRPIVRGLQRRQHGACHPNSPAGILRARGRPQPPASGRDAAKSSRPPFTRMRPRAARRTRWRFPRTGARSSSPTRTTTA